MLCSVKPTRTFDVKCIFFCCCCYLFLSFVASSACLFWDGLVFLDKDGLLMCRTSAPIKGAVLLFGSISNTWICRLWQLVTEEYNSIMVLTRNLQNGRFKDWSTPDRDVPEAANRPRVSLSHSSCHLQLSVTAVIAINKTIKTTDVSHFPSTLMTLSHLLHLLY